jgi:hypothetical protein
MLIVCTPYQRFKAEWKFRFRCLRQPALIPSAVIWAIGLDAFVSLFGAKPPCRRGRHGFCEGVRQRGIPEFPTLSLKT